MARQQLTKPENAPTTEPAKQRLRAVAGYFADPEAGDTDRLIYERVRLGIMSALSVNPSMSFAELKELLKTSDGNLSMHARKLEDAGYIACKKKFASRVPKTEYSLTVKGKRMFARHLEHMEASDPRGEREVASNARRNHHGRQRPLGGAARACPLGGSSRRRARRARDRRSRGADVAQGAHAVRVLGRQLVAARAGGRESHAAPQALSRERDGALSRQRRAAHASSAGAID